MVERTWNYCVLRMFQIRKWCNMNARMTDCLMQILIFNYVRMQWEYPVDIHNHVILHRFYHHVICCGDLLFDFEPEEDRWDDQDHGRSCWWPRSKFNRNHDRLGRSTDLKMICWMQIQGSFRTWRAKCWHLIGCTRETWQKYWIWQV